MVSKVLSARASLFCPTSGPFRASNWVHSVRQFRFYFLMRGVGCCQCQCRLFWGIWNAFCFCSQFIFSMLPWVGCASEAPINSSYCIPQRWRAQNMHFLLLHYSNGNLASLWVAVFFYGYLYDPKVCFTLSYFFCHELNFLELGNNVPWGSEGVEWGVARFFMFKIFSWRWSQIGLVKT